jgi:mycofactocin precursor
MVENTAAITEPAEEQDEAVEPAAQAPLVEEDLLVEDVSIDGMCGVY